MKTGTWSDWEVIPMSTSAIWGTLFQRKDLLVKVYYVDWVKRHRPALWVKKSEDVPQTKYIPRRPQKLVHLARTPTPTHVGIKDPRHGEINAVLMHSAGK